MISLGLGGGEVVRPSVLCDGFFSLLGMVQKGDYKPVIPSRGQLVSRR